MPDKPLTVATYAAGASLAAATLIYVFGPTFFLDEDGSSTKKKGVVGLSNLANDCFINSILQALAGLPDLRLYLIRETHRRRLDGPEVYDVDPERPGSEASRMKPVKLENLQKGLVTYALKDILDNLNERPIHKKVISPQPFIRSLERAFSTRISRQQQDAQEFLQIVTERLCDEYHAGAKARRQAQVSGVPITKQDTASTRDEIVERFGVAPPETKEKEDAEANDRADEGAPDGEDGFPFEGKWESQIECLTCGFKPKPSVSTFVTLTLSVPQQSSTTLNACLDGTFKVEHIDDFKCEFCRLEHAIQYKTKELGRATAAETQSQLQSDITRLQAALKTDPENPPKDIELPDSKLAPKRRIARHMYISSFPKVLALHLSRSVYAVGSISTKNLAKVSFPESMPLGGLLNRKDYRLLGLVMHKGTHNSGHYESFRRQVQPIPFSTPHSFGLQGAYSAQASPGPSAVQSPRISTSNLPNLNGDVTPVASSPLANSPSLRSFSSQSSLPSRGPAPTSAPREDDTPATPSSRPQSSARPKSIRSLKDKVDKAASSAADLPQQLKRKKKQQRSNRWWRISDDKIKESKTSEVLGMQKEVYLLFYELDRQQP